MAGGKIPFRTVEQKDEAAAKLQDNVSEALNRLGTQTLDDTADGKTYRKLIGVNFAHQLTNSGIATSTITAEKILTVSGSSLLPATVPVSALAACNQFSVYRDAAFSCPPGVYSALYANKVIKDTGNGWSQANAWYTIPTAGDWWFSCAGGLSFTNTAKGFYTTFLINSGELVVNGQVTTAATQYYGGGSYLYCNARVGDKIKVQFYNGDSVAGALAVVSGQNHFTGYQVR